MTNIENEIKRIQEAAAKKVAALKAKAAKDEQQVREVMLEVMEAQKPDLFAELRSTALQTIEDRKQQRSAAARKSRAVSALSERDGSSADDSAPASSLEGASQRRSA